MERDVCEDEGFILDYRNSVYALKMITKSPNKFGYQFVLVLVLNGRDQKYVHRDYNSLN